MLRILQRYHDRPIVLDDPALGPLQVSGVFDADRAETAVALLPEILPVRCIPPPTAACICAPAIDYHAEGGLRVVPSGKCLNPSEGPHA
ncbi:hypothetical protein NMB32_18250 [Stenotrophomonas sp. CD2]|nr:hypothetical protein NMB32_18250 [Stenotrophomonas sp. CD2]